MAGNQFLTEIDLEFHGNFDEISAQAQAALEKIARTAQEAEASGTSVRGLGPAIQTVGQRATQAASAFAPGELQALQRLFTDFQTNLRQNVPRYTGRDVDVLRNVRNAPPKEPFRPTQTSTASDSAFRTLNEFVREQTAQQRRSAAGSAALARSPQFLATDTEARTREAILAARQAQSQNNPRTLGAFVDRDTQQTQLGASLDQTRAGSTEYQEAIVRAADQANLLSGVISQAKATSAEYNDSVVKAATGKRAESAASDDALASNKDYINANTEATTQASRRRTSETEGLHNPQTVSTFVGEDAQSKELGASLDSARAGSETYRDAVVHAAEQANSLAAAIDEAKAGNAAYTSSLVSAASAAKKGDASKDSSLAANQEYLASSGAAAVAQRTLAAREELAAQSTSGYIEAVELSVAALKQRAAIEAQAGDPRLQESLRRTPAVPVEPTVPEPTTVVQEHPQPTVVAPEPPQPVERVESLSPAPVPVVPPAPVLPEVPKIEPVSVVPPEPVKVEPVPSVKVDAVPPVKVEPVVVPPLRVDPVPPVPPVRVEAIPPIPSVKVDPLPPIAPLRVEPVVVAPVPPVKVEAVRLDPVKVDSVKVEPSAPLPAVKVDPIPPVRVDTPAPLKVDPVKFDAIPPVKVDPAPPIPPVIVEPVPPIKVESFPPVKVESVPSVKVEPSLPVKVDPVPPVKVESAPPLKIEPVSPLPPVKVDPVPPVRTEPLIVPPVKVDPVKVEPTPPLKIEPAPPIPSVKVDPVKVDPIPPVKVEPLPAVKAEAIPPVRVETIAPVKVEPVPPIPSVKVDSAPSVKVDPVVVPPVHVDPVKVESPSALKVDSVPPIPPVHIDPVKVDLPKVDSIPPVAVESVPPVKVEPVPSVRVDPVVIPKLDPIKVDSVPPVKVEPPAPIPAVKLDPVKVEPTAPIKVDPVPPVKVEGVPVVTPSVPIAPKPETVIPERTQVQSAKADGDYEAEAASAAKAYRERGDAIAAINTSGDAAYEREATTAADAYKRKGVALSAAADSIGQRKTALSTNGEADYEAALAAEAERLRVNAQRDAARQAAYGVTPTVVAPTPVPELPRLAEGANIPPRPPPPTPPGGGTTPPPEDDGSAKLREARERLAAALEALGAKTADESAEEVKVIAEERNNATQDAIARASSEEYRQALLHAATAANLVAGTAAESKASSADYNASLALAAEAIKREAASADGILASDRDYLAANADAAAQAARRRAAETEALNNPTNVAATVSQGTQSKELDAATDAAKAGTQEYKDSIVNAATQAAALAAGIDAAKAGSTEYKDSVVLAATRAREASAAQNEALLGNQAYKDATAADVVTKKALQAAEQEAIQANAQYADAVRATIAVSKERAAIEAEASASQQNVIADARAQVAKGRTQIATQAEVVRQTSPEDIQAQGATQASAARQKLAVQLEALGARTADDVAAEVKLVTLKHNQAADLDKEKTSNGALQQAIVRAAQQANDFATSIAQAKTGNSEYEQSLITAAIAAKEQSASQNAALAGNQEYVDAVGADVVSKKKLSASEEIATQANADYVSAVVLATQAAKQKAAIEAEAAATDESVTSDARRNVARFRGQAKTQTAVNEQISPREAGEVQASDAARRLAVQYEVLAAKMPELASRLSAEADVEAKVIVLKNAQARALQEQVAQLTGASAQRGFAGTGTIFQRVQGQLQPSTNPTANNEGFQTLGQFAGSHITRTLGYAIPGIAVGIGFTELERSVREAGQAQRAIAEVKAQFEALGQSDQFAGFAGSIKTVSNNTGLAVTEVAELGLAMKGVFGDTQNATTALNGIATAAVAMDLGLKEAQTDLTAISQGFQDLQSKGGASITEISNEMLHLQDLTGVSAKTLTVGVADAAASANQVGIGFNQTASTIAAASQRSGLDPSVIGQTFSKLVDGITQNFAEIIAAFQASPALQGAPLQNLLKATPAQSVTDVIGALPKLSPAEQISIEASLGINASARPSLNALTQSGQKAQDLQASITPADRTAEEFNKQINTLEGHFQRLQQAAANFGIALINGGVGKVLGDAATAASDLFHILTDINQTTGGLASVVAQVGGAFLLWKLSTSFLSTIQGVIKGVTTLGTETAVTTTKIAEQTAADRVQADAATLDSAALIKQATAEVAVGAGGAAATAGGLGAAGAASKAAGAATGLEVAEVAGGAGLLAQLKAGAGKLAGNNLLAGGGIAVGGDVINHIAGTNQGFGSSLERTLGTGAEFGGIGFALGGPVGGVIGAGIGEGVAVDRNLVHGPSVNPSTSLTSTPADFIANNKAQIDAVAATAKPDVARQLVAEQAAVTEIEKSKQSAKIKASLENQIAGSFFPAYTKVASTDAGKAAVSSPNTPDVSALVFESKHRGQTLQQITDANKKLDDAINGLTQAQLDELPNFAAIQAGYQAGDQSFATLVKSAQATLQTMQGAENQEDNFKNQQALEQALQQQNAIFDQQAQQSQQFFQALQQQGSKKADVAIIGSLTHEKLLSPQAELSRAQAIVQAYQQELSDEANLATSTAEKNKILQQGIQVSSSDLKVINKDRVANGLKALPSLTIPGQQVTPQQQFQGLQEGIQATETLSTATAFEDPVKIAQAQITAGVQEMQAYLKSGGQKSDPAFVQIVAQVKTASNQLIDANNATIAGQISLKKAFDTAAGDVVAQAYDDVAAAQQALASAHGAPAKLAAEAQLVAANREIPVALGDVATAKLNLQKASDTAAGDVVAQAQDDRQLALQALSVAKGPIARLAAQAQLVAADREIETSLGDVATAQINLLKAQDTAAGNVVAQAQDDQKLANEALSVARGAVQRLAAEAQQVQANREFLLAINDVATAQAGLLTAMANATGDPKQIIAAAQRAAQTDLSNANKIKAADQALHVDPNKDQAYISALTQYYNDKASAANTIAQQTISENETLLFLGKETATAAIASLKAALPKVKGDIAATNQILTEIRTIQNSAGSNLNFDLPSTLFASTLYDARRLESKQGIGLGAVTGGPSTSSQNVNVTINVNGGSPSSVNSAVSKLTQAVAGSQRTGTTGPLLNG